MVVVPLPDGESDLVELRGLSMQYGSGTVALRGVDLAVRADTVHGLIGANGAGKSTLIKVLSGALKPTSGRIFWRGTEADWESPYEASESGLATVHQHVPLVPSLPVLDNVFLAQRGVFRRRGHMLVRYEELCEMLGYRLPPDEQVLSLSLGRRQMVAILQALASNAKLILLDEPTAALSPPERHSVFDLVREMRRDHGVSFIYTSHFLDEVIQLTDVVTVLRDGVAVDTRFTADSSENELAKLMVGDAVDSVGDDPTVHRLISRQPMMSPRTQTPSLQISNLMSPGKLHSIDLTVYTGEVVGIAGVLGSGRSELLHAIFGDDPRATGSVRVNGVETTGSTRSAMKAGCALVPEDRASQGLHTAWELWRNLTLATLDGSRRLGFLQRREKERARARKVIRALGIQCRNEDMKVSELSGGNAQKVVFGKWIERTPRLFLLDEPTTGVDVNAKAEIVQLVRDLATSGASVVVVSSEFHELLHLADRIIIMRRGRLEDEYRPDSLTEQDLVELTGAGDEVKVS